MPASYHTKGIAGLPKNDVSLPFPLGLVKVLAIALALNKLYIVPSWGVHAHPLPMLGSTHQLAASAMAHGDLVAAEITPRTNSKTSGQEGLARCVHQIRGTVSLSLSASVCLRSLSRVPASLVTHGALNGTGSQLGLQCIRGGPAERAAPSVCSDDGTAGGAWSPGEPQTAHGVM